MIISGLQKTTLLDYPGHVAATVFLGGCNFRCPFCHNMDIVDSRKNAPKYSEEEILGFLNKRSSVLDGVCITGGEPTLYKDLVGFIRKIKSIGNYLVKLDTNGTNPEMLKALIEDGTIDYVAMDIKSSYEKYPMVAGLSMINELLDEADMNSSNAKITDDVRKSIDILLTSSIEYEFRTTVIAEYHDIEEMAKIGEMIKGAKKYYLQSFTDSEYVLDHTLSACNKELLEEYRILLMKYVDTVELRGVD